MESSKITHAGAPLRVLWVNYTLRVPLRVLWVMIMKSATYGIVVNFITCVPVHVPEVPPRMEAVVLLDGNRDVLQTDGSHWSISYGKSKCTVLLMNAQKTHVQKVLLLYYYYYLLLLFVIIIIIIKVYLHGAKSKEISMRLTI